MRIMFLNCLYGRAGKPFYDYILGQSLETDTFCFTEVDPNSYLKLTKLLPNFGNFFETFNKTELYGYVYGQAVFAKKDLEISNMKKAYVYRNVINDVGFIDFFDIKSEEKLIHIANVHGKARPGTKLDTPVRIRQSREIIDFLAKKTGPKIIGGDFNLMPDTKSIGLFEENGYRNLIKDFGIKETRGGLNHKNYQGEEVQHFADFCFVTPDVKVKSFVVPDVEISDHLPLILDFEL